jgi:hypothetical protein
MKRFRNREKLEAKSLKMTKIASNAKPLRCAKAANRSDSNVRNGLSFAWDDLTLVVHKATPGCMTQSEASTPTSQTEPLGAPDTSRWMSYYDDSNHEAGWGCD